jgi:hypothetical protein
LLHLATKNGKVYFFDTSTHKKFWQEFGKAGTLQDVLNTGSTLTTNNTITQPGTTTLSFNGGLYHFQTFHSLARASST